MSTARHHVDWLSLVEVSGPFLSMSVLLRAFPQGLDAPDAELPRELRSALAEWEDSAGDRAIHRAWIRWVLRRVLELPDALLTEDIPASLIIRLPEHGETLRPDLILCNPADREPGGGLPRLLISILPPGQNPERELPGSRWKAPPATRMMELLHATGIRLGLVTNGERWMLVDAPRGETTGFISWYASLWPDEHLTLQAFVSLLGLRRWFGVPDRDTLEGLLAESAADQQEVTEQLGLQVRRAVEILVQAFDRIDKDRGRTLLAGVDERGLYDAALTVMMRLVFLLSVEERGLLPTHRLYDQYYAASTLRAQLREAADQGTEEVLERRYDAWSRLLAAFRAVHAGVEHEAMRLPAYGGTLFDPDRFPFLEGRAPGTGWRDTPSEPLPVSDRAVLHLLEALQVLQVRIPGAGSEARMLSFRALDIEQIGHVYESLLDHTAKRASEPVLALAGARQPEVGLSDLEAWRDQGQPKLLAHLKEATGRTEKALARALAEAEIDQLRLRVACDNDELLLAQVRPFAGLLRLDSSGYPVVITEGSVYVTRGSDRRSTGTHYTPRSLTEPIVRYSLEPLVYHGPAEGQPPEEWRLRPAGELLNLKICDMAMGSGAFLVQVCRYLAERLVEAWAQAEGAKPGQVVVTPEGALSRGEIAERLVPRDPEERLAVARRIVADRCIYGVDVNPMAVEMAKLSLWLVTLQRDRPFTFLDHALRVGDSLLGVDLRQLRSWSMARAGLRQMSWFEQLMREELERALRLRNQIERMPDLSVRDTEAKGELLRQADQAMALIKLGADLLVGTALAERRKGEALREDLFYRFQMEAVTQQERRGEVYKEHVLAEDSERLAGLRAEADRLLRGKRPFHWPLEFPEVFVDPASLEIRIGFDALVGNPPFLGGQKITGVFGTDYRDYLVAQIGRGKRGSADLCAYFFLRAEQLLRQNGDFGMLATNTIAQGDTREVGLDQIVAGGSSIIRALPSRKWPGAANLEVAEVWLRKGEYHGPRLLSGEPVPGITPFLSIPGAVAGTPYRLAANAGKSFQGSIVLGMGFVLTPEEAAELIERDPRNREVLFPYLNGEDLNSRPDQSPSRWVINFHDWPLERAEEYSDCMRIVREKVKPQRLAQNDRYGQEHWWQFLRTRPELYATIAGMEYALTVALVSNQVSIGRVSTRQVFAHKLAVFPLDTWGHFAVLQSHLHYHWAWEYSSTMRIDLNYSPSDCFDTFPLPCHPRYLDDIGKRYDGYRTALMLSRQEGLTKTYNCFHDPAEVSPDILRLRAMHVEMDRAVANAYGWNDLDLDHGFHVAKAGIRFTFSPAVQTVILDRLLTLNHERYAEEVRQGLHEKRAAGNKRRKGAAAAMPSLFDEEAS